MGDGHMAAPPDRKEIEKKGFYSSLMKKPMI